MSEEIKPSQEEQDKLAALSVQDVEQPKKKSLAEAAKELLAQKKKGNGGQANHQKSGNTGGSVMKSQHTNKPSNTRRKMGGS